MRTLTAVCGLILANFALLANADISRTQDGRPDLQGVWANNSATPLQRPEALGDKSELSDEEVKNFQARHDELFDGEGEAAFGDDVFYSLLECDEEHDSYYPTTGNYNHFWVVDREFENRTSLIVDPPNGRMPELTPRAKELAKAAAEYAALHPADSYTDRINSDRCITFGVPFIGAGYNGYFQIVQTTEHVAILQEMAHETRLIPLDGRDHIPTGLRQWNGDSRGQWDDDTLIIKTRNFSSKSRFVGQSSENLLLTERFTLLDADTLQWVLTVEDQGTWSQPWTLAINLKKSEQPIFEYACHEGNLSMEGILAGARAEEMAAAQSAGDSQ